MKAVRLVKPGLPEDLEVALNVSIPQRKAGEVLVQMHATSVNPLDTKIRQLPAFMISKPKILGGDVAGVVADCDTQSEFRKGDRVFGKGDFIAPFFKAGTYAEWVALKEQHLALIPDNVSFEQAAAAPTVCLSAWRALKMAGVQAGQRVLIHAGAGGIGHVAIQMAKDCGAHVTTTCSASSTPFVEAMGADAAIDYHSQRFEEVCRHTPFDVIVDTVGGDYEARSLSILKRSGSYVHILNSGWAKRHGGALGMAREFSDIFRGYCVAGGSPDAHALAAIARLMYDGRLKLAIDRTFPLDSAADAHCHLQTGHPQGKIVLKIAD